MTSSPPIMGVMRSPETVGLWPFTTCRYRGRKVTAPNKASPMMNPTALVTTNVRLRNSASGRIGSAARDSTNGNSTSITTLTMINAMMNDEDQA